MRSRRAAAAAAALTVSLPASALGQSAGDDQYRDPFAEGGQPQDQGTGGGAGNGQTAPDTSGQAAPAPAPGTSAAPAPGTTTPVEPTATTAATLPRTGLAAGLVAALGVLLLGAGLGLRRAAGGSTRD